MIVVLIVAENFCGEPSRITDQSPLPRIARVFLGPKSEENCKRFLESSPYGASRTYLALPFDEHQINFEGIVGVRKLLSFLCKD